MWKQYWKKKRLTPYIQPPKKKNHSTPNTATTDHKPKESNISITDKQGVKAAVQNEKKQDQLKSSTSENSASENKTAQPTTAQTIQKGYTSGFSLSSIRLKREQQNKAQQNKDIPQGVALKEAFTQEQVQYYWKQYAQQEKDKNEHIIASILFMNTPILQNDGVTLLLPLANESSKLDVENESIKLLRFLRKNLQNDLVKLAYKIDKTISKKKLYTPQDKLNRMSEINPLVLELKNRLRLEF